MLDPIDCVNGVDKTVKLAATGFFSWAAPSSKNDLYHLSYDPEDVLNVKGIRENTDRWVKDKVSASFIFGGGGGQRYWEFLAAEPREQKSPIVPTPHKEAPKPR